MRFNCQLHPTSFATGRFMNKKTLLSFCKVTRACNILSEHNDWIDVNSGTSHKHVLIQHGNTHLPTSFENIDNKKSSAFKIFLPNNINLQVRTLIFYEPIIILLLFMFIITYLYYFTHTRMIILLCCYLLIMCNNQYTHKICPISEYPLFFSCNII